MQMNDGSRDLRGRTGKGLTARGRILEHAADLIYTRRVDEWAQVPDRSDIDPASHWQA
ncbi:hypothetical protein [Streptomyces sp. NPDC093984]|uniref:hypothetical protein n=1 Tax=Streptomyces sp. NPDC093984 TaxID=3366052 RepID=UPI003814F494